MRGTLRAMASETEHLGVVIEPAVYEYVAGPVNLS